MENVELRLKEAITRLEQAIFGFDYLSRDENVTNDFHVAFNNLNMAYDDLLILKSELSQLQFKIKFNSKILYALKEPVDET